MSVVTVTRLRPVLLSVVFLKRRIISSVRPVFWNRFQTLPLQFRPQGSNKSFLKVLYLKCSSFYYNNCIGYPVWYSTCYSNDGDSSKDHTY